MGNGAIFFDNHIGFPKNTIKYFHYHDEEADLDRNIQSQPLDWKYRDSNGKLTYNFDECGFRNTHALRDISAGAYLATVGCSYTMGTGTYHEETYSYHLQELTGVPVYNMGLASSSNEVSVFNALWLLNNFAPPKALIFQKTSVNRFPMFDLKTPHENEVLFAGPWVTGWPSIFHDFEKFIVLADYYKFTELKTTMWETLLRQTCEKLGVALIEFEIYDFLESSPKQPDLARDLTHYGNDFNFYIATMLSNRIVVHD